MYLKRLYRTKAAICRKVFGKTKFFLGERVDYAYNRADFWESNQIEKEDKDLYFASYARYKTIELLAREVNERNLQGAVAELGVYKGTTSVALNILFPNKKIYLFDTFAGFDKAQMEDDVKKGYAEQAYDLTDTSAESVFAKMPYKDNCIIKKGFFPDTTEGVDERFCFVSLDVDLYQPILDGLRYFYPKLNEGGYIIVHDYNNGMFEGVRNAIREFEREVKGLHIVPVVDLCGSLVISK